MGTGKRSKARGPRPYAYPLTGPRFARGAPYSAVSGHPRARPPDRPDRQRPDRQRPGRRPSTGPTGAPSPAPATPLPGGPAVRLSGGPTRANGTGKRSTPSGGRGATLPYPDPPNRPGGLPSAVSGHPGVRAPLRSTQRRRPGPSRGGPPLKLHCGQCSFNAGSMAIHPRRTGGPAACPALRAAGPDPDPPRFTRFVDTRSTDDVYRR